MRKQNITIVKNAVVSIALGDLSTQDSFGISLSKIPFRKIKVKSVVANIFPQTAGEASIDMQPYIKLSASPGTARIGEIIESSSVPLVSSLVINENQQKYDDLYIYGATDLVISYAVLIPASKVYDIYLDINVTLELEIE